MCNIFPNVSKSLLIVWGTLSLPAKNDRGKCHIEGISMRSPHFPPSFYFDEYLPAILNDCVLSQTARGVPAMPRTPRCSVLVTLSRRPAPPSKTVFRFSDHCTAHAVCPCQGTWRDDLQRRLCVKCPISVCLAWRRSLDNSYPPRSSRNQSGKEKFGLWQTDAMLARQCPSGASCASEILRGESGSVRMRAIAQGMKG